MQIFTCTVAVCLCNNNNNNNNGIAYAATFPQSGSSSAGIRVLSASDIGQAASTYSFQRVLWVL